MNEPFVMFSTVHLVALSVFLAAVILLYRYRKKLRVAPINAKRFERIAAISLFVIDGLYYLWMIQTDRWGLASSLPLELCSISLLATILLLWTGNRHFIDFVLFAGIGGAFQAMLTPDLDMNFPHFRFFHFFFTHAGIILTGLYYVWVRGYKPTFKSVVKAFIIINALVPAIMIVNWLVDGNYMFLQMKPVNGSLLDFLGPYPWYLLSLEVVAFCMFTLLWLVLRQWRIDSANGSKEK
ncbi:TIGR02206 family membrane protein [Sporosarcina sp. Sa2YVA2]|uniref:TIGR02206 family membrane protein n=1 Tax=Sporosarcina quadrami TaxID=2762234 RepID=A0ABR8UCY9_9BACL|nr:TIGR02206 family membrane protein [Sporosarcina quadrami]MBD7985895.1 TIGR02206 family membrane protein [Sporosarcina quadrami]